LWKPRLNKARKGGRSKKVRKKNRSETAHRVHQEGEAVFKRKKGNFGRCQGEELGKGKTGRVLSTRGQVATEFSKRTAHERGELASSKGGIAFARIS